MRNRGFTLVEILIAISILAIVLTTIYAAYTGTLRIVRDTEYGDDIYSMARVTLKRMTDDLESICTHKKSFKFFSFQNQFDDQKFTDISFLSSAHVSFDDTPSTGNASIGYFIREGSDKETYVLIRRDERFRGEEGEFTDTDRDKGYIICDHIQSVTYTFYDGKGNEYETWDSGSDTTRDKAPTMVSIHLDLTNPDDRDNPYRFMTTVRIPMAGAK
ncbi:MAG: prepilin-type N-terminal cleavage/methylation domain-containing protein [Deltaproteobacteria bacterium]|nr:prepilin-type N-terminal cleavage/methylation domain-containing protein [Deltaproteobacteria bacterium]